MSIMVRFWIWFEENVMYISEPAEYANFGALTEPADARV